MPLRHFFAQSTFFFVQFTRRKKNHTLAQRPNKKSPKENLKTFARQSAVTAFLRTFNVFFVQFYMWPKNHTLVHRKDKKFQNGKFKDICATICRYGISSRNQLFLFVQFYQEKKKIVRWLNTPTKNPQTENLKTFAR